MARSYIDIDYVPALETGVKIAQDFHLIRGKTK